MYIYIIWSPVFVLQSVAQKGERIAEEESKCQHMADLAQHDLDEALPALQEAIAVSRAVFALISRNNQHRLK